MLKLVGVVNAHNHLSDQAVECRAKINEEHAHVQAQTFRCTAAEPLKSENQKGPLAARIHPVDRATSGGRAAE